ncbi:Asp-tRNA(Asn)/Glu-tRNA(Gln) amidotransferase subunit GatC [Humisphaera borealis]|uniref:Aspartyl/glutamyl-tRNA(Asn/Gln) amidotransferase subunit C n=1 Tax=Humisphaera borealis TaxID=2807512 RepID=A0A7M2WW29_9BACT|nr:Asp-tRNA(Asn)/Glu-tRNA(Gln) amidotransferase subunit GatC [Humisphaera borealis]QOV88700.1 Asp-tRNA(Asn)/Glu-tRNA(Gln) amidotransferase subunit GatC [Humisphaera borealis]
MSSTRHSITVDDVRKVARLARLSIPDTDLPAITAKLEPILGYIEQLNEVDTAGVAAMAHVVPLHNVLREDTIEPALGLEATLRNAPETDGPFFKVPKVIGEEDSAG